MVENLNFLELNFAKQTFKEGEEWYFCENYLKPYIKFELYQTGCFSLRSKDAL
jgi:hypothetical protein